MCFPKENKPTVSDQVYRSKGNVQYNTGMGGGGEKAEGRAAGVLDNFKSSTYACLPVCAPEMKIGFYSPKTLLGGWRHSEDDVLSHDQR